MADQKKYKTPEELGEAVGKKIEELFGGMFGDEAPQNIEPPSGDTRGEGMATPNRQVPSSPASQPDFSADTRLPHDPKQTARPRPQERPVPPPPRKRVAATQAPRKQVAKAFDDIVEQMEILILNLEWEASPESVEGLIQKFKELEKCFPATGQARTILAMNRRGLQRFAGPDAVPHPSLIKLLQDSLAVLKQINSSRGKRPTSDALIAGLSASYREIMAAAPEGDHPRPATPEGSDEDPRVYLKLVKNVGTTVHSL